MTFILAKAQKAYIISIFQQYEEQLQKRGKK
jgi:hypothetical protein